MIILSIYEGIASSLGIKIISNHILPSLIPLLNDEGLTKWTPALRASVESLAEKLESLDPAEAVEIEADIDNDPIGRFIRVATGECLAEIRR